MTALVKKADLEIPDIPELLNSGNHRNRPDLMVQTGFIFYLLLPDFSIDYEKNT